VDALTLTAATLEEVDLCARRLLDFGRDVACWFFEGQLGAGKTTLIQALCRALGITELVQSPTYGLAVTYNLPTGGVLHHLDLYRISAGDTGEALDMGLDYYFTSGEYCFVEWARRAEALWPDRYLLIDITLPQAGGPRQMAVRKL
jgi:tRNA threonylcarbamoyladenosine biosynthesis protein TsaE